MIGKILGKMRIEQEIGRGGMAVVYRGEHLQLHKAGIQMSFPRRRESRGLVSRKTNSLDARLRRNDC